MMMEMKTIMCQISSVKCLTNRVDHIMIDYQGEKRKWRNWILQTKTMTVFFLTLKVMTNLHTTEIQEKN